MHLNVALSKDVSHRHEASPSPEHCLERCFLALMGGFQNKTPSALMLCFLVPPTNISLLWKLPLRTPHPFSLEKLYFYSCCLVRHFDPNVYQNMLEPCQMFVRFKSDVALLSWNMVTVKAESSGCWQWKDYSLANFRLVELLGRTCSWVAQGHPDLWRLSSSSCSPVVSLSLSVFFCDVIFSLSSHSLLFLRDERLIVFVFALLSRSTFTLILTFHFFLKVTTRPHTLLFNSTFHFEVIQIHEVNYKRPLSVCFASRFMYVNEGIE